MFLFQSPNSPTIPQEKIHRITTLYPEDPRAPFYDPTGEPMLPLARLYVSRESVIQKSCDEQSLDRILEEAVHVAENTEDSSRRESCWIMKCSTDDWVCRRAHMHVSREGEDRGFFWQSMNVTFTLPIAWGMSGILCDWETQSASIIMCKRVGISLSWVWLLF
jgi:hypothetical protein